MDRTEEDMKFVGFFGIFKQSFKTIFSWKKIFTQITLAFILPLAIIYLIHMEISHHFFWKIDDNTIPYHAKDSRKTTSMDWLYDALFTIAYFIFFFVFSILATAAVVFTVASIYTGREVVFRNVMKVIPKIGVDLEGDDRNIMWGSDFDVVFGVYGDSNGAVSDWCKEL
ncbi:hypothetical protein E3N88_26467 [Mikania micrantha]|uniref:Uncharacterized protein n=1 Tax=Mikania micrantha TaxID=192012 RepID=A0A5N6NAC3_9ASTR|nr:hypothetical protein E3N88_26467 [Mikania micrantha]